MYLGLTFEKLHFVDIFLEKRIERQVIVLRRTMRLDQYWEYEQKSSFACHRRKMRTTFDYLKIGIRVPKRFRSPELRT